MSDQLLTELTHVIPDQIDLFDAGKHALGIASEDRRRNLREQSPVDGSETVVRALPATLTLAPRSTP